MSRLRDLALIALMALSLPVLAAPGDGMYTVKYDLKIDKRSLSAALQEFAAESGVQIIFFANLTDGHEAPALKGKYTAAAALALLLDHTDLTFQQLNSTTIEIHPSTTPNSFKKTVEPSFDGSDSSLLLAQSTAAAQSQNSGQSVPAATQSAELPPAQSPTPDAALSEVVVTGTRIRGVAPVGSNLITIDQAAMEDSGMATTNDILDTNPAILDLGIGPHTSGATAVQNGFSNINSPDIHGLGIQATLSLTNGHRNWEQGVVGDVFDPSSIPPQMIEQIEVVPDGTSPIYGADAIAGTVNYVLRKPADVAETDYSLSSMKGTNTSYYTGILGHVWTLGESDGGGFILSYQHSQTSALAASTFPTLYNNNFAPFGGSPSSDFAAPGNILVGSTTYAVPSGQNGQGLTLSQLGAAGSVNRENIWAGAPGPDITPGDTRDTVVINYNQKINDWLQFFGDSEYDREDAKGYMESTANDIAASVPNTNPYSPCNPSQYSNGVVTGPAALLAACAKGSLTVNYNDLSQVGPELGWDTYRGWESSNGVHISLPDNWEITPQMSLNQSLYYTARTNLGTPNPNTFNYFCDPNTYNCTQPGQIAVTVPPSCCSSLASETWGDGQFLQVQSDGPLFALPGGTVRLAAGVEDDFWSYEGHTAGWVDAYKRDRAVYSELYVPIVGRGNAIPGIQSLEVDVAGRLDDYSDTGRTTNPKIGVNWSPFLSLKFHASYGTSFRGPPIHTEVNTSPISWIVALIPDNAISSGLCPQCTNPALYGLDGASKLVYQEGVGVNPMLSPETAKSFSAGFDWTPEVVPGFEAGLNWWGINYINQVGTPEFNAGVTGAINAQVYNDHIIYNPTFFPQLALNNPYAYYTPTLTGNLANPNCAAAAGKRLTTQTLFNEYLACTSVSGPGQTVSGATSMNPNDVLAFTYFGNENAGVTVAQGADLKAGYTLHNDWGTWTTNFTGEYIPKFDVAVIQGAPRVNEAGQFGYVLKFKGRLQLKYDRDFSFGSLSPSLFINYDSHYTEATSYLPGGVPSSYADISTHATLDASILYKTGTTSNSWLANNITVTLSAQNVLNELPPRVLENIVQYDPAYGWPPARVVQLQIGKSW
jgi:iron complex outermembrane recepter protein